MHRRDLFKLTGNAALIAMAPDLPVSTTMDLQGPFRFCLNMSTISGQKPGLLKSIDIAAEAGYDGIEIWIKDVEDWLAGGHTIDQLAAYIGKKNLRVENAISFTAWMSDDDDQRKSALLQLEKEMRLMADLGCTRIAAPPAGISPNQLLDVSKAGTRYRETLQTGRKYKVMPLLEFWGSSPTLYNFSQALAIAAAADDPEVRILPDVYHLFRGGSGFNCLNIVNGKVIDIIHMNDYPVNKPVHEQTDADRIFPGDGSAPFVSILQTLKAMGGPKVLSLELFNKAYWQQDAFLIARTGLQKMKDVVTKAMTNR